MMRHLRKFAAAIAALTLWTNVAAADGLGALSGPPTAAGPWTPSDNSGQSLGFTLVSANYSRVGNMVFAYFFLNYPSTANASQATIKGLPIPVPNQNYANTTSPCYVNGGTTVVLAKPLPNSSAFAFYNAAGGAAVANSALSTLQISCILIYPAS